MSIRELKTILRPLHVEIGEDQINDIIRRADVNGDGIEDVFLGGAFDQSGRILLGTNSGNYTSLEQSGLERDKVFEDVGATFFDARPMQRCYHEGTPRQMIFPLWFAAHFTE